jgi:hypothetical protein
MEASILDLRYHMKKVLQALDRNEEVKIFYHGKLKGILTPAQSKSKVKAEEHPFFGMHKNEKMSVDEMMNQLRGDRYHAL